MNSEKYAIEYLDMLRNSRKQIFESLMQKPISGEEYVIAYLAEHQRPVYPSEISKNMNASTARVAAILKHLEYISAILRNEDLSDARKHPVVLSPSGEDMAKKLHAQRLSAVTNIFDAIGEQDTEDFIRIFGRIIEVCNGMEANNEKLSDCKKGSSQIF